MRPNPPAPLPETGRGETDRKHVDCGHSVSAIHVFSVGTVARQRLGEAQDASLLGITRRGWLVQLDVGWVVFLSREAQRGPLTLNLGEGAALPPAEPGMPGEVLGNWLFFAEQGLRFDFRQAAVWSAPPAAGAARPAGERSARLRQVARAALAGGEVSMLGALLPPLLGLDGPQSEPDAATLERVQAVRRNLQLPHSRQGWAQGVAAALAPLLGLGRGLTPSGDDLALGLLLALRRWGPRLGWSVEVEALSEAVAGLAQQRTTTLAANLIACAGMGQADERLLRALDGIVTGEAGPGECAAWLKDWGATSGVDALVGMTLIL